MVKQINWNKIKQNKPAIFDWLVFLLSFSMGFIFPSLKSFVVSSAFSNWMLAALVLYIGGIYLKHRPLYYRLARSGNKEEIPYRFFLIIGHWVIMFAVVIFAEQAFRRVTGLPGLRPGDGSGFGTVIGIFLAAFITWLAFRPGGKSKKIFSEKYLFRRELVADVFLISGVAMLSFVFWEKSIFAVFMNMPMGSVGDVCMRFILLSLAYVMFYLPLRYLYLIEDHFSRQAWRRLMLIFILILLRGLFAALNF